MRKQASSDEINNFLWDYAKKAGPGGDPNDRQYSRQLEELIKHLDPEQLDALMRGEDESMPGEVSPPGESTDE